MDLMFHTQPTPATLFTNISLQLMLRKTLPFLINTNIKTTKILHIKIYIEKAPLLDIPPQRFQH